MIEYEIVDTVYHNILNYFKAISWYPQYIVVYLMKIRDRNVEKWEKELRERLQKEVPEGMYDLSSPGFTCWTGKGGYIDFEVALRKQMKNFKLDDNAKNI